MPKIMEIISSRLEGIWEIEAFSANRFQIALA
jgi:hypothetical protein